MYLLEFFCQLCISQSITREELDKSLHELEERARSIIDEKLEHKVRKMLAELMSSMSG